MFYVPILLFAGFSIYQASAVSLALIFAASVSALFVFHREKMVDWKLAALIDPPTDIMAFVGGYLSGYIEEVYLKAILCIVLFISAVFLFKDIGVKTRHIVAGNRAPWWNWHRRFNGMEYNVNLLLVLPITGLIGLLAGMLGITGGVVKLPLMVIMCGVPMEIAIATSTVMIAVTALFGMAGHFWAGHIDFNIWPLMLVTFLGGRIGSGISIRINKRPLGKVLSVALFLIASKILIDVVMYFLAI